MLMTRWYWYLTPRRAAHDGERALKLRAAASIGIAQLLRPSALQYRLMTIK